LPQPRFPLNAEPNNAFILQWTELRGALQKGM
jgi:hypothetical protein